MCVYLKIVEPKTMSQLLHLKSLNILKAISLCLFVSCNLTNNHISSVASRCETVYLWAVI